MSVPIGELVHAVREVSEGFGTVSDVRRGMRVLVAAGLARVCVHGRPYRTEPFKPCGDTPKSAAGCLAPASRGSWAFVLEYGRDSNGKRLQTSMGSFPAKFAAREALQERVRVLMTDVSAHTLSVGEYLDTWLAGKHALKPTTHSQYRDFTDAFLKPHLGGIRPLEVRAHHLDAFYISVRLGRRGRPSVQP